MVPTTVQKFGKFGRVLCTVLRVFVMIGIVGSLIGAITLATVPDQFVTVKLDQTITTRINMKALLGNEWEEFISLVPASSDYETDENGMFLTERADSRISNRQLASVLLTTALTLGIFYALLVFLRRFSTALCRSATPFVAEAEKNLRSAGIVVILLGCVPAILNLVLSLVSGMSTSSAAGLDLNFDLNLGYICIGIALIGLSYVFAYGRLLQEKLGSFNPYSATGNSDFSAGGTPAGDFQAPSSAPAEPKDPADPNFHPDAF